MSITEALTKELMEELNCNTVFTIPAFGGIKVPESVVVTWIIMALLILLSILLTRNLSIDNPGKVQLALESGYQMAESFFGELLGANGLKYLPYLLSVLLYIAVANLIGLIGFKPPTKRYGCYRCNGRYEHCSGRSSRNPPKRNQRLVERFLGTNMDRSTDQSFEVFTRPLSLCMRLFGNVLGSYVVMELLKIVVPAVLPAVFSVYFDIFDGLIQAFVFVFLTALYIGEAVEMDKSLSIKSLSIKKACKAGAVRSKLLITYRQRRKEVNYDTVNRYWSRYCSFDRYWSWYWYWYSYIQSSGCNRKTAGSRTKDQKST